MEYNMMCGCKVTVSEDTLDVIIDYCEEHSRPAASTELGKQIADIVAAADHLADSFSQNLSTMLAEGNRIVNMLKALKGEKEDDEQDETPG